MAQAVFPPAWVVVLPEMRRMGGISPVSFRIE
jgi:hypothetical protein